MLFNHKYSTPKSSFSKHDFGDTEEKRLKEEFLLDWYAVSAYACWPHQFWLEYLNRLYARDMLGTNRCLQLYLYLICTIVHVFGYLFFRYLYLYIFNEAKGNWDGASWWKNKRGERKTQCCRLIFFIDRAFGVQRPRQEKIRTSFLKQFQVFAAVNSDYSPSVVKVINPPQSLLGEPWM